MPPFTPLFTGLVLLGALSPLLTFAALAQQKEWRLDRLREHLRRDGVFGQLFGKVRPALLLVYIVTLYGPFDATGTFFMAWAGVFAALSAVQILTRRQRMPRWTAKALLVAAVAIVLTGAVAFMLPLVAMPFIIVLQPLFVLAAWLLLKPLDALLKKRIMARAATLRASLKDATVIGIAGSVGKTTTKELIAHLLQDSHPAATPARVNTEMGVAQWLLDTYARSSAGRAQHTAPLLIVEMGAYRTGEIALLCRIAQPTVGVITALGSDHLALFGSEEAIVQANGELLAALPANGHAFLYGDNDGCKTLAAQSPCPVTLTGTNDLIATDIAETPDGMKFSILPFGPEGLRASNGNSQFSILLHGHHNIHNALLAIGVARHLGISDERIAELLKTFRPPAHTFGVRTERGVLLLDDTYNISPLSMAAALDWAARQPARPRVLLTSGLQETGAEENRFLRELGTKAKSAVEHVIFTQPHGTSAFAEGFGTDVEVLHPGTARITEGAALLAVGRMPLSTIQRLLPNH